MGEVDRWITDWEPSPRFPYYTRANAGEVLPDPVSPLSWTLAWEQGVLQGWRDGNISFGIFRPDELDEERPETVGTFAGRFYINLSATRMNGVRIPGLTIEAFDAAAFGGHPDVPPYQAHPDDECSECSEALAERLGWVMTATEWPDVEEDRRLADKSRANRPDLASLDDAQLVERARAMLPLARRCFEHHVHSTVSATVGPGIIAAVTTALGDVSMTGRLIAGVGDVDSAAPSWDLWKLSRAVRRSPLLSEAFDLGIDGLLDRLRPSGDDDAQSFTAAFDDFVRRHGSRGPNEWDIRADTWETKPALALAAIERMRLADGSDSPQARFDVRKADRETLTEQLSSQLAGDAETQGTLLAAIASALRFMAWRERTKTNCVKVLHEMRVAMLELGRRAAGNGVMTDPHDVMMLLASELDDFVASPASFAEVIAERRAGYDALFAIDPPFFLVSGVPPLAEWPRRQAASVATAKPGEQLTGMPGCPGTARGRARIVTDPSQPGALEPGDVLVAPLTDPSWTPLFVPAAAVVVDMGAQISHAVIVSRELGIPCAVSVTDATKRIADGAMVEVDGSTGVVTVL